MLEIDKIQKRFPHLSSREIAEQYDRDITQAAPLERRIYRPYPASITPAQRELFEKKDCRKK